MKDRFEIIRMERRRCTYTLRFFVLVALLFGSSACGFSQIIHHKKIHANKEVTIKNKTTNNGKQITTTTDKKQNESTNKIGKNSDHTTTVEKDRVSEGTVDLDYAVYTGSLKNGEPHGTGTLRFKKRHQIDSRDSREAGEGDEVTGDFLNGHLTQGKWRKNNGKVVTILIGA